MSSTAGPAVPRATFNVPHVEFVLRFTSLGHRDHTKQQSKRMFRFRVVAWSEGILLRLVVGAPKEA